MTDFNLILLLVGIGLLLLVVVLALLGFFAGLKKELKCTAIFAVLIILTLLIFGDPSVLLNADGSILKGAIPDVPSSAKTVWDCILGLARAKVENGAELFADGTKSYALLYDVAAGLARGVSLIAGLIGIMVITLLVNVIYRIVSKIVAGKKAKKKANEATQVEENKQVNKNALPENVVVSMGKEGKEGVVLTSQKNPVEKKKSLHRGWGAALAAVRGVCIVMILLFPVSGVCNALENTSDDTKQMLKDVLNGDTKKTSTANDQLVDTIFDFVDAYQKSAIGKVNESSAFFFKDSISTHMFDSAFKVTTDTDRINIRTELSSIIDAANALEGNTDFKNLPQTNVNNALDELKNSNLIPAVMPIAIEYGYYSLSVNNKPLRELLFNASQETAYLKIRDINWKKDLKSILDAAKYAYELGVLKEDFNYLTMDTTTLKKLTNKLTDSDAVNSLLNVVVLTGINLEQVTSKVGEITNNPNLSTMDWKKELFTVVEIYDEFKKLEINSLDQLKNEQLDVTINDILNSDEKTDNVINVLTKTTSLQLINKVAMPLAVGYCTEKDELVNALNQEQIDALNDLANNDWSADFKHYLEAVKDGLDLVDLSNGYKEIKVDYMNFDVPTLRKVVDDLFKTKSINTLLPIATSFALNLKNVKDLFAGETLIVDTSKVNWEKDFTSLVDMYANFQLLEIENIDTVKADPLVTVKDILNNNEKSVNLENILTTLAQMDLYTAVGSKTGQAILNKTLKEKFPELADILKIDELTNDDWKEDFCSLVAIAKDANAFCELSAKTENFDLSDKGVAAASDLLDRLFGLNILGDDLLKNNILMGVLTHYQDKLFTAEQLEKMDFSSVTWNSGENSEVDNLKRLVEIVGQMQKIEGFDINSMEFVYDYFLADDYFIELTIDALEVLTDSNLTLEMIPSAIDKFVVPNIQKYEDEDKTIEQVLKGISSEVLIQECQKLVNVAQAAIQLGVLKVKDNGVNAVDFGNTDAMKTIVNGIFDSKLIENHESRVLRILLKTTLFEDLDKSAFDGVDFDREQQLLIDAIDSLEVVLKDERFLQFDENGKVQVNVSFYTSDETLDAAFNCLNALLGEYRTDGETDGSMIVEVVLPEAYSKYIEPVIPSDYAELIRSLKLQKLTGKELMSDVRHLVYIGNQVCEMQLQAYLVDKDFDFSNSLDYIDNIVDAAFDMNSIKGNENEIVAWGVNFACEKANIDAHVVHTDFKHVAWDQEVETIKQLIGQIIDFANLNKLNKVSAIKKFIEEKQYLEDRFLNDYNLGQLINICEQVTKLQAVDTLLPVALDYGIKKIKDKDIDVSFLSEGMTAELLAEDLRTLLDVARIAINDIKVAAYYRDDWTGALPAVDPVIEAMDLISQLNILSGKGKDIVNYALDKVFEKVGTNKFVAREDVVITESFSGIQEYQVLKEIIKTAYTFFEINNLDDIGEVKEFIKSKWYLDQSMINNENVLILADVLEEAIESQIFVESLPGLISNVVALDEVKKFGDFKTLESISVDLYQEDIRTIASVLRKVIDFGAITFYKENNLEPIDYSKANAIVTEIGTLNILEKSGAKIVSELVNYFTDKANINITTEEVDFCKVDFAKEFDIIGNSVEKLGVLFTTLNLDSVEDIKNFIKDKDYQDKLIYTNENAALVIDTLQEFVSGDLIASVANASMEYLVALAKDKGYNIDFIFEKVSTEELQSDITKIVEILKEAVDFGAVEYLGTEKIEDMDLIHVANIIDIIGSMNIVNKANAEWVTLGLNKALSKLDGFNFNAEDFAGVNWDEENVALQEIILALNEVIKDMNLTSTDNVKTFISEKTYLENIYTEHTCNDIIQVLQKVADSSVVQVMLPKALNYGVDLADGKGLDIGFLSDLLTKEELAQDIKALADILSLVIDAGALQYLDEKDLTFNFDKYDEIIAKFNDLNLLNKASANWAVLATNFVAEKVIKYSGRVELSDFNNVADWTLENNNIRLVVGKLGDMLQHLNLETISDVKDFINNAEYKKKSTINEALVNDVADIFDILAQSKLIVTELDFGEKYLISSFEGKGKDISFISIEKNLLAEDISVLAEVIRSLNAANVIDFVINDEAINYANYELIVQAVAKLINLNTLNHDQAREEAIALACKELKVNLRKDDINVDWATETEVIKDILRQVKALLIEFNINTISDVKALKLNDYLKIDENLNKRLAIIADLLEAVSNSELVECVSLPISAKYNISATTSAYADIHNIYNNGSELTSDIYNLSKVVRALEKLDINDVVNNDTKIPYENTEAINEIIREIFSLNYLNNENRINVLLSKITKYDLSGIDGESIDLAADAEKLISMYQDLLVILSDNEFAIQRRSDLNNIKDIKIDVKYWANEKYRTALRDALDEFTSATLFTETDGQICLIILPLIKNKFADIYDALEIENIDDPEVFSRDFDRIIDVIKYSLDADLTDVANGNYFTENVKDIYSYVIDKLVSLEVLQGHSQALANVVVKRMAGKSVLGVTIEEGMFDFTNVDFKSDALVTKQILADVFALAKNCDVKSIDDVKDYIKTASIKGFLNTTGNTQIIDDIIKDLLELTVVKYQGLNAYDLFAYGKLNKYQDYLNLKEIYGTDEVFYEDLVALEAIYKEAINNNLFAMINDDAINFEGLNKVITKAGSLKYLDLNGANVISKLINTVTEKAKIDVVTTEEDFSGLDFVSEFDVLGNAVEKLGLLLQNINVDTIENIKNFVNNKDYNDKAIYTDENGNYAIDAINELTNGKLVATVVDLSMDYITSKASEKGLEVDFLNGLLSIEEINEDLKTICEIGSLAISAGAMQYVCEKDANLDFAIYQEIVAKLDNLNVLNKESVKLAVAVTNYVAENIIKYTGKVEAEDFANVIDWTAENQVLRQVVGKLGEIVSEINLVTINDVKDFIKNGDYKNKTIYTEGVVNLFADLVEIVSNSQLVLSEVSFGEEYLISLEESKNRDVSFILIEKSLIQEDLVTLANIIRSLNAANVIDFVINNEALDYANYELIVDAVGKLINLNTLNHGQAREEAIALACKELKVNLTKDDINVNWANETEVIKDILRQVKPLLIELNINTINDAKSLKLNDYLKIDENLNKRLTIVADLLEAVSNSELVECVALPISAKYNNNATTSAYADIHNIYNNGSELTSDIYNLSKVVRALEKLDINDVVNNDTKIPYDNTEVINEIIREIFGLNYLNNEGRIDTLLTKVTKYDLTGIDGDDFDLRSDADKLIAMYEDLQTILTDEQFFLQRRSDLNNMNISIKYWSQEKYCSALKDAFNEFVSTTLYTESNGQICLVFIPLLKNKFEDVYNALELDSITDASIYQNDLTNITDVIKYILDADLYDIAQGNYFTENVKDIYNYAIDKLSGLKLLEGHGAALANVVVKRMAGKKVLGVTIEEGMFDFTNIDFKSDALATKQLLADVIALANNCDVKTIDEAKDYIKTVSVKGFVNKTGNTGIVDDIIKDLLELTVVKYQGLNVYNTFAYPRINKYQDLLDLETVYASDEEFYNELNVLEGIYKDALNLGLVSIMNDDEINYNQASLVKETLNKIATLKYINQKLDILISKLDEKLTKVDLSEITAEDIDLENDLGVFGEAYEELVPVLMSSLFPLKSYSDYKDALNNKKIANSFLRVYDYDVCISNAVQELSDLSVGGKLLKIAYTKYNESSLIGHEYIDPSSLTDEELKSDLASLTDAVRYAIDFIFNDGLYEIPEGYNCSIESIEDLNNVIDALYSLNILKGQYGEIVKALLEKINVDTTSINLDSVNWDNEISAIKETLVQGGKLASQLGLTNANDAVNYVKDLYHDVKNDIKTGLDQIKAKQYKTGYKTIVSTIKDELRKLKGENIVNLVDQLDKSELFDCIAIEVYNQKVYSKLTGNYATLGDLHDYSSADLANDMSLISAIVRDIFDSKINKFITSRVLPDESCIPYLEDAVKNICMLEIVDIKKQDVCPLIDSVLERINLGKLKDYVGDLSSYTMSSVSFKDDKDIYASMVSDGYKVLKGYKACGLNAKLLGNTETMQALVDIYTKSLTTSLMDAIGDKAYDKVFVKLANKAKMPLKVTTGHDVLANIGEIMQSLIDLGVFSNNGIDFTNQAVINNIRTTVINTFTLSATKLRYVNKLADNIHRIGMVPFSWNNVSVRQEYRVFKQAYSDLRSFVTNNKSSINAKDFAFMAVDRNQIIVTNIVRNLVTSSIVNQLFFPAIEGFYNVSFGSLADITLDYEPMTHQEFIDNVLPDVYELIVAANDLGLFNNSPDLYDFVSLKKIVNIIRTDAMIKDNIDDMIIIGYKLLLKKNFTEEQIDEIRHMTFANDLVYVENALQILADTYATKQFKFDADILKDSVVGNGIADALEELLKSNCVNDKACFIIRTASDKVLSGDDYAEIGDFVTDRLDDETYTDELASADLNKIPNIIRNAVSSNILIDQEDYSTWNYESLDNIVDALFEMNMVKGHENDIMTKLISKIPFAKDIYDDTMTIGNWKAETCAIIDTLEALVDAGITEINKDCISLLTKEVLENSAKSLIVSTKVVSIINDLLDETPIVDETQKITVEEYQAITNWQVELDAMKAVSEKLDAGDEFNYDTITSDDIYKLDASVLFGDILRTYLKDQINAVLADNDFTGEITDEQLESINTQEKWDTEYKALQAAENLGSSITNLTADDLDALNNSILIGDTFRDKAKDIINDLLVDNSIIDNAVDGITVAKFEGLTKADWQYELDVYSIIEDLPSGSDIISSLTSEQVSKINNSKIIGDVFKQYVSDSINDQLCEYNVIENASDGITSTNVEGVTDWDAELDAYQVFNGLSSGSDVLATLTGSQVSTINNSVLVGDIFRSYITDTLNDQLTSNSVISDVSDGVTVVDVEAVTNWDAELDAYNVFSSISSGSDVLGTLSGSEVSTINNSVLVGDIFKGYITDSLNDQLVGNNIIASEDDGVKVEDISSVTNWDSELDVYNIFASLDSGDDVLNTLSAEQVSTINNSVLIGDIFKQYITDSTNDELVKVEIISSVSEGITVSNVSSVTYWDAELDAYRILASKTSSSDLLASLTREEKATLESSVLIGELFAQYYARHFD